MDPLSALSIAAGVAQFLDFAVGLISGSWKRYRSATGTLEKDEETELLVHRLLSYSDKLHCPSKTEASGAVIATGQADQLQTIVQSCKSVADELLGILSTLKIDRRHRLLESLIVTARAIAKEKKVQDLLKKLVHLQSELSFLLLAMIQYVLNLIMVQRVSNLWSAVMNNLILRESSLIYPKEAA